MPGPHAQPALTLSTTASKLTARSFAIPGGGVPLDIQDLHCHLLLPWIKAHGFWAACLDKPFCYTGPHLGGGRARICASSSCPLFFSALDTVMSKFWCHGNYSLVKLPLHPSQKAKSLNLVLHSHLMRETFLCFH